MKFLEALKQVIHHKARARQKSWDDSYIKYNGRWVIYYGSGIAPYIFNMNKKDIESEWEIHPEHERKDDESISF